ncbi:hypothetical protein GGF46_004284 [Coemansia sp. RSA 552]|nr:hypothetical protein GGF46_004284 [Coemansia sp. RSA 552]
MAVRLSEPINSTLILPFAYQMVADLGVAKTPKDVAFYASLLFASFSVCQTMTIMYWSRLSDRIGRRPVIIVGLVGYLVSFLLFGLSRTFTWALATRCLNGLLAGNVAVIKSVIAEISDDSNRARMMALLPLTWNIGMVIGSAIGGIFVDPARQYPGLFGDSKIFRTFPYLLPCLIGCSVTVFGLIMSAFKLEETLVREPVRKKVVRQTPTPASSSSTLATENTHLLVDNESTEDGPRQLTYRELLTPTVVRVMMTNVFMALSVAVNDTGYPIFAASDPSDGGLGFTSRGIGFSLALSGVAVMYLQLVTYPRMERKYGALYCYQFGQRIIIPFYLAIPFLSILAARTEETISHSSTWSQLTLVDSMLWILLIALLLIRTVGIVLAFTSINLLTANLAPSRTELGFMNGIQQVAMSSTRFIGPILAGAVWSWSIKHDFPYPFNSHMVWVLCAVLTAVSLHLTFKLPAEVNTFAAGDRRRDSMDEEA